MFLRKGCGKLDIFLWAWETKDIFLLMVTVLVNFAFSMSVYSRMLSFWCKMRCLWCFCATEIQKSRYFIPCASRLNEFLINYQPGAFSLGCASLFSILFRVGVWNSSFMSAAAAQKRLFFSKMSHASISQIFVADICLQTVFRISVGICNHKAPRTVLNSRKLIECCDCQLSVVSVMTVRS